MNRSVYMFLMFLFVGLLFSPWFSYSSTATVINSCPYIINSPGKYVLNASKSPFHMNDFTFNGVVVSFCIYINSSDVMLDLNGSTIYGRLTPDSLEEGSFSFAIVVNPEGTSTLNNITVANGTIVGSGYGIGVNNVENSTFYNLKARRNRVGFYIYNSTHVNLSYNHAEPIRMLGGVGFYLESSNYTKLVDNAAHDGVIGFYLYLSNNNTLVDNTAYNNYPPNNYVGEYSGFVLENSSNNTLDNNVAYNNYFGFVLSSGSNNNVVEDNTAYYNYIVGFRIHSSSNNSVSNNNASYNNYFGFNIDSSSNNVLTNNIAQENNWSDLFVDASSNAECNNNISNMIGSGGRPINYTNETVNWQNIEASEVILCNADNSVIENVTVEGSDTKDNNGFFIILTDNATINNSNSSYNYFGFYLYSISNTTITNNIAQENNLSDLFVDASSNAECNNNISNMIGSGGRPINYTNETVNWQNIEASEIILCNADNSVIENATVKGSNTKYNNGFFIILTDNATINNSNSSYNYYGFSLDSSINNTLTNNFVSYNRDNGIELGSGSNNNTLINNTAIYNGNAGIYLVFSDYNMMDNNTVNYNNYGFYIESSHNNTVTNANASYNSEIGFYLEDSDGNVLANSLAQENTIFDLFVNTSTAYTTYCNNNITNMTGSGNRYINYTNETVNWQNFEASEIILCNADNSIIENVTVKGSDTKKNNGFLIILTDNATINNSNSSYNYYGFYAYYSSNNTITYSNASNNYVAGFYFVDYHSKNNTIAFNNAYNNQYGFYVDDSGDNNITSNNASSNNYGFYIFFTSGNNIANNNASYNDLYGLYFLGYSNNLTSNVLQENGLLDLYLPTELLLFSCSNNITNTIGSGGLPIKYTNETVNWQNFEASEVILCNAHNSSLTNITVNGSGYNNNGLLLLQADNVNITNISLINTSYGVYSVMSDVALGNVSMNNTNNPVSLGLGSVLSFLGNNHFYNIDTSTPLFELSDDSKLSTSGYNVSTDWLSFGIIDALNVNIGLVNLSAENVDLTPSTIKGISNLESAKVVKSSQGNYYGLNVTNTSTTAYIKPILFYDPSDLSEYPTSYLKVAGYDAGGWYLLDTFVNTTGHYIYATADTFSYFAPLVYLLSPSTGNVIQHISTFSKVDYDYSCADKALTITVNDSNGPVNNAKVRLADAQTGVIIASGNTNQNGVFVFNNINPDTYILVVSKPGYYEKSLDITLACEAPAECEEGYELVDGVCKKIEEKPPEKTTTPTPSVKTCSADTDCADTEYCDNNVCVNVEKGDCGYIANHSWVSYECCADTDCSPAEICKNNACVEAKFSLDIPEHANVGESVGIDVKKEGEPLKDGSVKIVSPSGEASVINVVNGKASFTPKETGKYTITLIVSDLPVSKSDLQVYTKSGKGEKEDLISILAKNGLWIVLGVIIVVFIGVYYFYRTRYMRR